MAGAFDKYFELTEKVGWRLTDLDWDHIDFENISELDRRIIVETSVIEHGVPHYVDLWLKVDGIRDRWDLWQFVIYWAGEEHRHSQALNKLAAILKESIQPTYEAVAKSDFSRLQKESCPSRCYETLAGNLTYTTIQELVTWQFYFNFARQSRSSFVKQLIGLIAKDELRHHVYYAQELRAHWESTPKAGRDEVRHQIVEAVSHFDMPHGIYPFDFPFFDGADAGVFGAADWASLKLKLAKVFAFDARLLWQLSKAGTNLPTEHAKHSPELLQIAGHDSLS